MRAVERHVRRLIEEPDAFPFVGDLPQIFRCVDELLGTSDRIARIHRDETAGAGCQRDGTTEHPRRSHDRAAIRVVGLHDLRLPQPIQDPSRDAARAAVCGRRCQVPKPSRRTPAIAKMSGLAKDVADGNPLPRRRFSLQAAGERAKPPSLPPTPVLPRLPARCPPALAVRLPERLPRPGRAAARGPPSLCPA
jgi:hypothetical protein